MEIFDGEQAEEGEMDTKRGTGTLRRQEGQVSASPTFCVCFIGPPSRVAEGSHGTATGPSSRDRLQSRTPAAAPFAATGLPSDLPGETAEAAGHQG